MRPSVPSPLPPPNYRMKQTGRGHRFSKTGDSPSCRGQACRPSRGPAAYAGSLGGWVPPQANMPNCVERLYRAALAPADSTNPAEAAWLRQAGGVLLYGTVGSEAVLRPDGSVWTYGADNPLSPYPSPPWPEATRLERWGALTLSTTLNPEVGRLLPKRPPGAKDCTLCKGTGYIHRGPLSRGIVCPECGGLGWKPL